MAKSAMRKISLAVCCAAVVAAAPLIARAEEYPSHPNEPVFIFNAHLGENGEEPPPTLLNKPSVKAKKIVEEVQANNNTEKQEPNTNVKEAKAEKVAPEEREKVIEKAEAQVVNGTHETLDVAVTSWKDLPFKTVLRQSFDYSCGSAAIATLLTYIYGRKTSETEVFKSMFDAGDKDKIRSEGFSLLDMRNYLNNLGYKAAGYKMNIDTIQKHKVPFIALINRDGYNHFVVVKSISGPVVLVGDPSRGNVIYTQEEFLSMWNGISLIITNNARQARNKFMDSEEWSFAHAKATPGMGQNPGLDSVSLPFPNWQLAPSTTDLIGNVSNTILNFN